MIETRGLTKRFGRHVAVDALTMDLASPGVVGFLGPNGAGKTTTLRMLTGALAASEGVARIGGFDVLDQPFRARRQVGYLPAEPPWYPALTVGETLRFAAELLGLGRAERLRAVGRAMERVGLRGVEDRLVSTLSGGLRKRLGLARAILHEPAALILDEPTTGLDPQNIKTMRELVTRMAEDRLVLLSSHLLPQLETLCEQVLLMHEGRRLAHGTVAQLAQEAGVHDWVELVLDAPEEDVSARIAGLDAVEQVRRIGPHRYEIRGGDEVEPGLAAVAGVRGWRVRRLLRHPASLEAVFVALVEAQ